ncbi:MAG: imidazole glycerol phosphate synthase cyclase subunit [Spirochaetaceae bacterium]|nr:imidazole glycerol phosphate synthase cyclase subunit [Spirochaetaceae bacterium]
MSGTAVRIVPCLDIRGGRVVKGVRFKSLVDSGEPAILAKRYENEGADEIALLDISATLEDRNTALDAVSAVRGAVSIPVSAGGGIKCASDAERLLNAGADRVSVNSAALRDPELISRIALRFGVQCVIVAIDAAGLSAKVPGTAGWRNSTQDGIARRWEVVIDAGKTPTGIDVCGWAKRCAALGAGEILLTSIDRDGTGLGYDTELVAAVVQASGIPVIASGGAVAPRHFLEGIKAGASAVLGAGVFHRGELTLSDLKGYLAENGVEVRI